MQKHLSFISGLLIILTSSCMPSITGNGDVITQTREATNFTKVNLNIAGDVSITKADNFSVKIEGESNILELLKTEVINDMLVIEFDEWGIRNFKSLKIYVTMPSLNGVHVSGSGKIESSSAFSAVDFDMSLSGSGDIVLKSLDVNNVDARISGSGNIHLENNTPADYFDMKISGSGDLHAQNFQTKNFAGFISGSGNCRVNVSETLEAKVSGSGDIHYTGNPEVNASVSGSGKVRAL